MSELYRVEVFKCGRWRQAHSQKLGLNREVPTEGSLRQTIDLTNGNGLMRNIESVGKILINRGKRVKKYGSYR